MNDIRHLHRHPVFTQDELEALPEPVRRYLASSIRPGTPLSSEAMLEMSGSIKLGGLWLPFRADQTLAPHGSSVWAARIAGVISGEDRYVDGRGEMRWSLFGLIPVVRASGPDIARSSAGRFGAEAIWLPTALLRRHGVSWSAEDDDHITAGFSVGDVQLELHLTLDADGRIGSVQFDRWSDPDGTGRFGLHPFGVNVDAHATFAGLTIPASGRGCWIHGTDRWSEGEFFRYEITSLDPAPSGVGRGRASFA